MRKAVVSALDVAGGIAGAGLIFCGVLLVVIGTSERRFLNVSLAVVFLIAGSTLSLTKRLCGLRAIVGAVFVIVVITSFLIALFRRGWILY